MIVPNEETIPAPWKASSFASKHRNILYYPADDSDSLDGIRPARSIPQRRLLTLKYWFSTESCLVLSSVFGSMHQNISSAAPKELTVQLTVEEEYDIQSLSKTFQNMGYLINRELDSPGMFKPLVTPFIFGQLRNGACSPVLL